MINLIKYKYYNEIIGNKITDYNIITVCDDIVISSDGKHCALLDINGNFITDFIYDSIKEFRNGVAIFKRGKVCGFLNKSGEEKPLGKLHHGLEYIGNGYYKVYQYLGFSNYNIIDSNLHVLYNSCDFLSIIFNDNSIVIKEEYLTNQLCDKNFNEVAGSYHYLTNVKYGIMKTGSLRINTYDYKQRTEVEYGVINEKGNELIKPKYKFISIIDDKRLMVGNHKGKVKIVDYNGKTIKKIKNRYDKVFDFHNNITNAVYKNKTYLINDDGDKVYEFSDMCNSINRLKDGNYKVAISDKWGIIDQSGNIICDIKYMSIQVFNNGNYGLFDGKTIKVVSKNGELLFEAKDGNIMDTESGYVLKNSHDILYEDITLLDKNGSILFKKNNNTCINVVGKYIVLSNNLGKEIIDYNGNTIIPVVDSNIKFIDDDKVILDNKIIDLNSEFIDINYHIRIEYEDVVIDKSFKSMEEREKLKKYIEECIKDKSYININNILNNSEKKFLKVKSK